MSSATMDLASGFESANVETPAKKSGKAKVEAADVRIAAKRANETLLKVQESIEAVTVLLEKVSKEDAQFSTRDSISALLNTLEDVNVKSIVKDLQKIVKARLVARATEEG